MSIVNFAIPKQLENRVQRVIKEKGFASKAEFFRFAAIYFMDVVQTEDERMAYLSDEIAKVLRTKYKNKTIPSLEEQLADL